MNLTVREQTERAETVAHVIDGAVRLHSHPETFNENVALAALAHTLATWYSREAEVLFVERLKFLAGAAIAEHRNHRANALIEA